MKKITFMLVLASVIAVAMLLGACDDSSDNSSSADNASVNNSSVVSSGNISENDSTADNNASEDASDDVSENASSNESGESFDDNSDVSDESNTSEGSDISDESNTSDDSSVPDDRSDEETSTEPEILGSGTEDDPYLAIPDEDMHVVTVEIPAGKEVYYSIYRVGGMRLKIKSSDAYVVYDGKTYSPKSDSVTLNVESAMASDAILFCIGNSSSSAKSFELIFTNPTGTYMNPTVIDDIDDEQFVELDEGDSVGHYYKYVAEKNGTLKFAMSATADSMMSATNNRNSAQRTTEADGSEDADGVKYIELEVQKGDEIIIQVGALPNRRGKYPASDITWSFEYK